MDIPSINKFKMMQSVPQELQELQVKCKSISASVWGWEKLIHSNNFHFSLFRLDNGGCSSLSHVFLLKSKSPSFCLISDGHL